jgi:hypothetical protein
MGTGAPYSNNLPEPSTDQRECGVAIGSRGALETRHAHLGHSSDRQHQPHYDRVFQSRGGLGGARAAWCSGVSMIGEGSRRVLEADAGFAVFVVRGFADIERCHPVYGSTVGFFGVPGSSRHNERERGTRVRLIDVHESPPLLEYAPASSKPNVRALTQPDHFTYAFVGVQLGCHPGPAPSRAHQRGNSRVRRLQTPPRAI